MVTSELEITFKRANYKQINFEKNKNNNYDFKNEKSHLSKKTEIVTEYETIIKYSRIIAQMATRFCPLC